MERVLADIPRNCCVVYLDGHQAHAAEFQGVLQNLHDVLQAIRRARLNLNPKKCHLFHRKVSFLGHVISGEGQRMEDCHLPGPRVAASQVAGTSDDANCETIDSQQQRSSARSCPLQGSCLDGRWATTGVGSSISSVAGNLQEANMRFCSFWFLTALGATSSSWSMVQQGQEISV